MATIPSTSDIDVRSRTLHATALHWSAVLLVAASWVSAFIFGAYILAFFGGTALSGRPALERVVAGAA